MLRLVPIATGIAAVIGCGVVHGLWTDRWTVSDEPLLAAAKLQDVGLNLGDWQGRRMDLDASQLGGATGSFYARYTNTRDSSTVVVFVVTGRHGPVSEHTPDVCYKAGGYEVSSTQRYAPQGEPFGPTTELWTSLLTKTRSAEQSYLRIFWAWSPTGTWSAPDNPRFTFAGCPVLYKLYLIRELPASPSAAQPDDSLDHEPCIDLMRQLLPELHRVLFSPS
jgi:hypothetical protein